MTGMRAAVIVDAVRTPSGKGKPGGALSGVHPVDLLAGTLEALLARTGLDPALVEDVIVGCAQQVGEQSGNIARNAVLAQPPRADRRPVRAADHVRSRRDGQCDDHRAPLTRPESSRPESSRPESSRPESSRPESVAHRVRKNVPCGTPIPFPQVAT
jgi:Thiolase, N-terminal domain